MSPACMAYSHTYTFLESDHTHLHGPDACAALADEARHEERVDVDDGVLRGPLGEGRLQARRRNIQGCRGTDEGQSTGGAVYEDVNARVCTRREERKGRNACCTLCAPLHSTPA